MRKQKIKNNIIRYIIISAIIVISLGATAAFAGDWGYGVVIANGGLNMRSTASLDGEKISVIPDATVISVNAMTPDGHWYDVTYNGQVGYVSSDYLSLRTYDIETYGKHYNDGQEAKDAPELFTKEEVSASVASIKSKDITEGEKICEFAATFLGVPYVSGGTSPEGFDCSGLVQYVYSEFGYKLPRTATEQCESLSITVDKADLRPGDLIFFKLPGYSKPIGHVGIYVGDNQFIHATYTGDVIRYGDLNTKYYIENYVTSKRLLS